MIESIIRKHLQEFPALSEILTKYAGEPAVFNSQFPDDQDESWESGQQYPRLVFELDMSEDPERKISGTLLLHCYFNTDSGLFPEEVDEILKSSIDGYFFSDETDTISVKWRQTDPFYTPESGNRIAGLTVSSDVVAFPCQMTTDPDPIAALNGYIRCRFPECVIIGIDNLENAWKPTNRTPAVYFRFVKLSPGSINSTYNVTWYDPTIQAHIMCPGEHARNAIVRTMAEELTAKTRLILADRSPFMYLRATAAFGADPLKAGQVTITGTYGVLREYAAVPEMNHIKIKENTHG